MIDRYPDEPANPYEPVLTKEGWKHIQSHPEITQALLHRIIEESEKYGPDEVYKRGEFGDNSVPEWIWIAEIDGVSYAVKGQYRNGRIEIGTAFEVNDLAQYKTDIRRADYVRIYHNG